MLMALKKLMRNRIPLTRAEWEVTDVTLESRVVREHLQCGFE